jgi:endonuclease YncB( thermonuclease family)
MKHLILSYRNRSKNFGVYILVFGILIAILNMSTAALALKQAQWDAVVVGVTDGDTITVLTPTKEEVKIRLYGVDAPERKQSFGTKSREFLASLVFGQTVVVAPFGKDLYGRTIAKIFLNDRDVGLTCIEYGYCWWYQTYAKKEITYKKAQAKARKQELGLWVDVKPIPPWEFRKAKK